MKNTFRLAVTCVSALLLMSACGGGGTAEGQASVQGGEGSVSPARMKAASIAATATSASFDDELLSADTARWYAANWSNGDPFVNAWHPNQLSFQDGRMNIRLEADVARLTAKPAISGEYRTIGTYQYGLYKARLIASRTPGTISAFFTYTGPASGTQHDEIDVELKGDDLTRVQVNYWTNGVEHPTLLDLGFDASAAYHDYAFRWTSTGIQWFVDDKLVHQENGSRGPLPVTAGLIMLNHWGTVGASPWSSDYIISSTPSVMGVERVSFTSELAASNAVVSVGALAGSAYPDAKGWRASISVAVRNASGVAVPGAVVKGGFTVGGAPLSCTSGSNGMCSITSAKISAAAKSTTFLVRNITGTAMTYDATKNAVASVVVVKP